MFRSGFNLDKSELKSVDRLLLPYLIRSTLKTCISFNFEFFLMIGSCVIFENRFCSNQTDSATGVAVFA